MQISYNPYSKFCIFLYIVHSNQVFVSVSPIYNLYLSKEVTPSLGLFYFKRKLKDGNEEWTQVYWYVKLSSFKETVYTSDAIEK